MEGRYWDDVQVGDKEVSAGRTITETDLVNFLNLSWITEPMFTNMEYITKETLFKKKMVPGPLTYAIAEGLYSQLHTYHGTALAFLGLDELRVPAPTFPGDTVTVEAEIIFKRETKNLDRGIIVAEHRVRNQEGKVVMQFKITRMIRRRESKARD